MAKLVNQEMKRKGIERIVSGGQTGVDRAALDVALELGLPCGGWCPKRRRAEDGSIPARYYLKETASTSYPVTIEMNVSDSDGTLILTWGRPSGGTATTLKFAKKFRKPYLVIDLSKRGEARIVEEWGEQNGIRVLNVAGLRESEAPAIYDKAVEFLREVFRKGSFGRRGS